MAIKTKMILFYHLFMFIPTISHGEGRSLPYNIIFADNPKTGTTIDMDTEMTERISKMRQEMLSELTGNILPFWMERMKDTRNGGFLPGISGKGVEEETAGKGAILNARILWTFSAAYRVTGVKDYLDTATRAKREIIDRFYDRTFGGVYWSLDREGRPCDRKKQIYALGFAIYGLSEYARATGDSEALEYAVRLFHDIENHSFDHDRNGYLEAFAEDWSTIDDMRLSEKDLNECKTMNTHLHILEPYTALYRVWKDQELAKQLRNLIILFTEKILDRNSGHLQLFFDENWNSSHNIVSYGHDIEASWLLHEAAEVLGDPDMLSSVIPAVESIADAASEGYIPGGGMIYEFHGDTGAIDADRHWWVQAETVVGYFNLWQITGRTDALEKAGGCWDFIRRHIIDREGGEWFWSLRADGSVNTDDDKAGFWKCPYHNGRMCLEIIERTENSTIG